MSAGTGPAATEIMRLIEQRRIHGEDAAELIAQMPKNLRLPTEEMQKRFFVSINRFVFLCLFVALDLIEYPLNWPLFIYDKLGIR